ncbi:MAG: DUF302 domain-containing protein [Anaerolineae bacterium]|nr:MAG: DUF302 domain-containing protein [Anaerolineae bacterium]
MVLGDDFDTVLDRVASAPKEEGFGILTEIDIQATMESKLGIDYPRYRILGACNPMLAHKALSAIQEMELLLPCNVTVLEAGDGKVDISIVNPLRMMDIVDDPSFRQTAEEAQARLSRVALFLKE